MKGVIEGTIQGVRGDTRSLDVAHVITILSDMIFPVRCYDFSNQPRSPPPPTSLIMNVQYIYIMVYQSWFNFWRDGGF